MIKPETIEEVRTLFIKDVVEKFGVELKKSGANWVAPSPFTNEKTPSFYVVPAKNIYKCFSSGKGGSNISFVMEKEGLEYVDAIKEICKAFQIRIEYDNETEPVNRNELELLYKINHATARQYVSTLTNLPEKSDVLVELIDKRKFTKDTLLQWQIGYAPMPEQWNFLSTQLINSGNYQPGIDMGLIKTKGERTYDAFRDRIVFPIIDHQDRYIGFGGRAMKPDNHNPKYLNSSDSKVFAKSKTLFGLNHAAQAIKKLGFANLMEGYTDVISFHQAGQINSVGTCGTALTDDQARLLKRFTDNVVIINDPDEAGQNATERSIDILVKHGFHIGVLPLPSTIHFKPVEKGKGKKKKLEEYEPETVFILERTPEVITYTLKHVGEEMEVETKDIDRVEKIDPDELIRMY